MERRMRRTLATRFGFLATDKGRLRWLSPRSEPLHMTRIVHGLIETKEPTHELDIKDLEEVREQTPAARAEKPAEDPTRELDVRDLMDVRERPRPAPAAQEAGEIGLFGEGDILQDFMAGAVVESAEEPTRDLSLSDLFEVRPKPAQDRPPAEEEDEERDGPAPSVVASLADLRKIADEKAEEARMLQQERVMDRALDSEFQRFASVTGRAPAGQEESGIFAQENIEDLIEPAEFELPQLTEPMAPGTGSVVPLFQGPEEGKSVWVTPSCSVVYLDHDKDKNRAHLRVEHKASGAYEIISMDLACRAGPVFATDEGLLVGIKAFDGRIDAKIAEAPPHLVLPDFKAKGRPGRELESTHWHPKSVLAEPVDLGHGFMLTLGGGGFRRDCKGVTLEIYLSDKGNPRAYSKEFQYIRRFRLEGSENSKTFVLGQLRVDLSFNKAGVVITKRENPRETPVLLTPSTRTKDKKTDNSAFEEAFGRTVGNGTETRNTGQETHEEAAPHGFEDVMGEAQAEPQPAKKKASGVDRLVFEEICRQVKNNGLGGQDTGFLIEGISDGDRRIRALATGAFAIVAEKGAKIGGDAVMALTRALRDQDREVKENANDALFYAKENGDVVDNLVVMTLEDPGRKDTSSVLVSLQNLRKLVPRWEK